MVALVDFAKQLKYRVVLWCDNLRYRFWPNTPKILQKLEGAVAPGSRKILCVFAHFDRDDQIDDYVAYYLQKLDELGCEVVFVSTASGLRMDAFEKIRSNCRAVIVRENEGHDFGSWKTGLMEVGDLSHYDRLILANDSVYGPLFDLGVVIEKSLESDDEVWGITDSLRFGHHLQSYFLMMGRSVLSNSAFVSFWQNFPFYRFKHAVIFGGEIGFSRLLVREGFKLRALCPFESVRERHLENRQAEQWLPLSVRANMTHKAWETLLTAFHCPFLKVQLLRDNPTKLSGVERWREIVSERSEYDVTMISRHLQRVVAR